MSTHYCRHFGIPTWWEVGNRLLTDADGNQVRFACGSKAAVVATYDSVPWHEQQKMARTIVVTGIGTVALIRSGIVKGNIVRFEIDIG